MQPSQLVLAVAPALVAGSSLSCPADVPLSCHNTTAYDNTCCFDYPGGQILQTQFWDTNPSTGPSDSWTIHGLWPDNCDGTYAQFCDSSRQYTNISQILQDGAPSTLQYMQTYWKDYQGNDETFWEHEFGKHGTCMSTFDTSCYDNYQSGQEVVDFFTRTVQIFKTLPSYSWLSDAGIVPSTTKTYTLAQIQTALTGHHGHNVIINCHGSEFNELWYHFNVRGSVQSGQFVATDPVGPPSTCPKTGIKYLPKSGGSSPPPTTTTKSTTTTSSVPTGSPGSVSGKGYVYVQSQGSSGNDGFLISSGKWYRANGTPATYTATPNSDGSSFTLSTSKGKCAIQSDDSLLCASSVSNASTFSSDGSYLTYAGSSAFYATDVPTGSAQGTVYASAKDVSFQITWTST